MNNKGFTLIEVLGVLVILSIIMTIVMKSVHTTMSVGQDESYKIMKNNLISVSYQYIQECNEGLISCDFSFQDHNQFPASVLKDKGYFKDLKSPIDGKDLGSCLILEATMSNGVTTVELLDYCY